jgi:hypothetical protein
MRQTTLRFGEDLWQLIESEAERLGLSNAQYVREAALARAAYDTGRRGDRLFEIALERAGAAPLEGTPQLAENSPEALERHSGPQRFEEAVREASIRSEDRILSSKAVWAQAELARERARELRSKAGHMRGGRGVKSG